MGRALEVIHAQVANSGAGPTAAPAVAGDSLQIRNGLTASKVAMIQLWSDLQAVGFIQVFSSLLHDTTRALRFTGAANQPEPFFPYGAMQPLKAQDTLTAQISAVDAAGDLETIGILNYYEDLPGAGALLATWEQIKDKIINITTVEATITAGAGGGYTGAEALNAESDLLHANTFYALLGAALQVQCTTLTLRGPDTSNMRVGIPGSIVDRKMTADWFKELSIMTNLPLIPILNSANKAGTFIEVVQDENAAAVPCSLILAELGTSNPIS